MGGLTIGTIGVVIYNIHKAYKLVKADLEAEKEVQALEDALNVETAKVSNQEAIVKFAEVKEKEIERRNQLYEDTFNQPSEDEEEEDVYIQEEEEVSILQHDKDSAEALNQFITMNLSDVYNPVVIRAMADLYRTGLTLRNNETVSTNLIQAREDFFGPGSKWNTDLSVADLILYFTHLMNYDLGDSIESSILLLLENLGIYDEAMPVKCDTARLNVDALVNHELMSYSTYGLFGLDSYEMNVIVEDMQRTQGNSDITFQAEYNKYLEGEIG